MKTTKVEIRFDRFGKFDLKNASLKARILSVLVINRWKKAMTAPSNSVPNRISQSGIFSNTLSSVVGRRAEGFPNNALAYIRGDK